MLKTKTIKILFAILILLPLAGCGHRVPLDQPDDMVIDSASF